MANRSKPKIPPASLGVTASGIVEAVTQDVELSMQQVKEAAQDAVVAVEKKLGMRKAPARKPVKKPKAKAAKTMQSRAVKAAKISKVKTRK